MAQNKASTAVLAKTRALYGRRLTDQDFGELVRKHSVSEVIAYLRGSTYFGSLLQQVNENLVDRRQIETLLRRYLFQRNERLVRFSRKPRDTIFGFYYWEEEVRIVLLAVRQVNQKNMDVYVSEVPGYLNGKLTFDIMSLAKARNQDDLCTLLHDTPYAKLIGEHRHADGSFRFRECEQALYQHYYDRVFAAIGKNYGNSKKNDMAELFSRQVEAQNTEMIYRFKRYFPGEEDEITHRLIRKYDPRSAQKLKELIEANSPEQVLRLAKSFLKKGQEGETSPVSPTELGIALDKLMHRIYRSKLYLSRDPDVVYVSYIMLAEQEVRSVIRVLEGVFYLEDPAMIESMAVLDR